MAPPTGDNAAGVDQATETWNQLLLPTAGRKSSHRPALRYDPLDDQLVVVGRIIVFRAARLLLLLQW